MEVDRPTFLQELHFASHTNELHFKSQPKQTQSISMISPVCPIRICIAFCKSENKFRTNQAPGKIQGRGAAAPFLVVLRGFAKGKGSHANPAKRFVWEKEEQRNGRGLSAASGGQDERCGVCSDANPPLLVFFSPPAAFSFVIKGKGG